jgi:PAS domain-containing protein
VLEATVAIFECDRACVVYPCEPEAPVLTVPISRTRPDATGTFTPEPGLALPMDPDMREALRAVLSSSVPVTFGAGSGPGSPQPLPAILSTQFQVQSQMATAIYPKIDKPYMFGLHQCSHARRWTAVEVRLFQEVGRRLADALTSVLAHRVLRESEHKLAEAQRITHVGYWDRDFDTDYIVWSDETFRIFGLPPQSRPLTVDEVLSLIHPDDRQPVLDQVTVAINTHRARSARRPGGRLDRAAAYRSHPHAADRFGDAAHERAARWRTC